MTILFLASVADFKKCTNWSILHVFLFIYFFLFFIIIWSPESRPSFTLRLSTIYRSWHSINNQLIYDWCIAIQPTLDQLLIKFQSGVDRVSTMMLISKLINTRPLVPLAHTILSLYMCHCISEDQHLLPKASIWAFASSNWDFVLEVSVSLAVISETSFSFL